MGGRERATARRGRGRKGEAGGRATNAVDMAGVGGGWVRGGGAAAAGSRWGGWEIKREWGGDLDGGGRGRDAEN